MSSRLQRIGGRVLVDVILLAAGGCGQEFVIGVLDGTASGGGSVTSATDPTTSVDGSTDETATSTSTEASDSSSTGPPVPCEAPMGHTVCDSDDDVFHAIGLNCPGEPTETYPIVDAVFSSQEANAFRVIREYGNLTWSPTEGTNLLALTTGLLPTPDGSGRIEIPQGVTDTPGGNNGNPDAVQLPAPIVPEPGSAGGVGGQPYVDCDGSGDCSESLPGPWEAGEPAYDLISMAFDVDVPAGTLGYEVDLAWFSAEFAARASSGGTDIAVWWQSSEAFTGNVATIDGQALSASEIAPWLAAEGISGDDPALLGTGHEGLSGAPCDYPGGSYPDCPRGGATGWMTLAAPTAPGERVSITVALFDLGDMARDTTLLLDNWRWACDGCQLGVDCGLAPRARSVARLRRHGAVREGTH